jgi:hypothetical protein
MSDEYNPDFVEIEVGFSQDNYHYKSRKFPCSKNHEI